MASNHSNLHIRVGISNRTVMNTLTVVAIVVLCMSYWFQIWKIHQRKHTGDLSFIYYCGLAFGFGILIFTAHEEDTLPFFVKQIATFIPVSIIIGQIIYWRHKNGDDD